MREAPFPSFTVVRVGKSLIFPRFPQFVVALLWEGWESLRSFSTLSTALFPLSCIKSGKVALSLSSDLPYSRIPSRIPGSRISDSGSRLEPEGESPGRPDSDCGNGVMGS